MKGAYHLYKNECKVSAIISFILSSLKDIQYEKNCDIYIY